MLDIYDIGEQCVGKRFIVVKSDDANPPLDSNYFPGARPLGRTADGGSQWQYRADHLLKQIRRAPVDQNNLKIRPF